MAAYAYESPLSTPPGNINEPYIFPGYATYTVQHDLDFKPTLVDDDDVRDDVDFRKKTGHEETVLDFGTKTKMDAPDVDVAVGEGATEQPVQQQPQRLLTPGVQNTFGDGSARISGAVADSNLIDDNDVRMPFSSSPIDDQARGGSSSSSVPHPLPPPPPRFQTEPRVAPSAMSSSPRPLPTYHIDPRPLNGSPGSPGGVGVAISSNARAQAQHPTYITPPSSPKPMRSMAVNSAATSPGASAPLAYSPSYPSSPAPLTPEPVKDFGNISPKNRADMVVSPVPYISGQQLQYQQQIRSSATSPSFIPDNYQRPQIQNDYRGMAGLGNINGMAVGREICIECTMRDQDMADVDVTSPGIWERESDVLYRDLCAAEEVAQGHSSHSGETSREGEVREGDEDVIYSTTASASTSAIWSKPGERPRAKGNRLTEANVKLWLTMNPREPQARQQTLDLYVKTQRSMLEAEALARARALQETRAMDDKVRDTFDHLRRSTVEFGEDDLQQTQSRLRPSVSGKGNSPRRSTISGGTPIVVSPNGGALATGAPNGVYGHGRHQSAGTREITLLENGMMVEHVDVRKEEKERRREEKRERKLEERRERERVKKVERASIAGIGSGMGSMGGLSDVQALDSGYYTNASTSDRERDGGRPSSRYSVSQLSTRATSVPMPISPPPSSTPSMRPANTRLQSQVSLADTQSIVSSISGGVGLHNGNISARRSRFFAFRNWSEAWRSRESFATGATGGISGSMVDMHLALDNEKHRSMAADSPNNLPSVVLNHQGESQQLPFPRRSVSDNLLSTPIDSVPDKATKKRKGLAKLWKIVTGQGSHHKNRSKGSEVIQQMQEVQAVPRSEDDLPLAPPPSLSYLVNRSSVATRERTLSASTSTARRVSTPSIVCAAGGSTTALPTPTSIRNLWQDQEAAMVENGNGSMANLGKPYEVLPVHVEETNSAYQEGLTASLDPDFARTVHPAASAPDMRQRMQDTPSFMPPPPPLPGAMSAQAPGSSRPISVYSLHKSLPPLPGQSDYNGMSASVEPVRPRTMYDLASGASMNPEDEWDGTIRPPEPGFRREERRQSFGGMGSRPQIAVNARSLPLNNAYAKGPSDRLYNPYDEMGSPATRAIGQMEAADRSSLTLPKRRSRFGLSSLLEKISGNGSASKEARRSLAPTPSSLGGYHTQSGTTSSRPSESDLNVDGAFSNAEHGYISTGGRPPSSKSRHGARASRMSVASRKAIEELVDQDPDFVAYRYPSAEQNIGLIAQ